MRGCTTIDARRKERTLSGLREICLSLPETSERLNHGEPTFFVPPCVGRRGWLGFRFVRTYEPDELVGICEDAYAEAAPKELLRAARAQVE
jgi:hypothetical protein